MTDVPDEVRRLAAERQRHREERDFAAADALRTRIAELGYRVSDAADGWTLEPVEPPPTSLRLRPEEVPSALDLDPEFDASVHWLVEGWPEDVARGIAGFRRHAGGRRVQHVITDATGTAARAVEPADDVELVPLVDGTGWGSARNAGLRRTLGRTVLVVDGSIEPAGDVFGPIERALADASVGVCGPFGIVTSDLREFEPSDGPDVDAIEGYVMALRRDVLRSVGGFDERFRWYRSADVELSFRIKDLGLRAVVVGLPVKRHEHRMWVAVSEEERQRWSRRNFNRFLDRFRGRFDLTVAGARGERPPA